MSIGKVNMERNRELHAALPLNTGDQDQVEMGSFA